MGWPMGVHKLAESHLTSFGHPMARSNTGYGLILTLECYFLYQYACTRAW